MGQRIIFFLLYRKCDSEAIRRYCKCDDTSSPQETTYGEGGWASSNVHEPGSASGCRLIRLAAKAPAERVHRCSFVHVFMLSDPKPAIIDIGTNNYGAAESPLPLVLGNNTVVSAKPILESDALTPNLHVGVVR